MSTDLKRRKSSAVAVSLLLVVSIALVGIGHSGSSRDHADEENEQIILVEASGEKELMLLDHMDLTELDTYNDFKLIEAGETAINSLKANGVRVNTLPSRTEISVKGHTFDIAEGSPELDPDLSIEEYDSGTEGLYIVHMLGPINPGWREVLEGKGVDMINYVPNYAYEVSMTPEIAEEVEDLFFVDWIGIYQPEFKISDSLPENYEEKTTVNVRLVEDPDPRTIHTISSEFTLNRSLEGRDTRDLKLDVTSEEEIEELALMNDVYFVSRYTEPELHSEVDSQIIGGGLWFMDDEHDDPGLPYRKHGDFGAYINQIGYAGKNVTIAIADTGIGNGTIGDAGHPDLTGRVIGGYGFEHLDEDHWVDGHGHGTHVTGSAAGDTYGAIGEEGEYPGFGPYLMGQGLAYDSELYAAKIFDPGWVGADYYEIVQIPKRKAEAYIHSNSWGARTSGEYTESDEAFDEAVRDADRNTTGNQQMVITVSAGNSGPGDQSTGSPANAKNVITVGATRSFMPDGSYYGGRDTDDPFSVARFSSRGWTEDNRIKPDVVAPGENVLSLDNPNFRVGGTYDWKSGTSMSNPAVAGACAVIVEWYEENHGETPSPAMVKSLLINTARDVRREECDGEPIPNKDVGWGMVDISKLEYPKDDPVPFLLEDQNSPLETGQKDIYNIEAETEDDPLKVSLVWTDKHAAEGDDPTLKNDLNLEVESPTGELYRGNAFSGGWTQAGQDAMTPFDSDGDGYDDVNNVENVYIHPDEVENGVYNISVEGFNVPEDGNNDGNASQDYALVVYNAAAPSVEITSPSNDETVRENSLTAEWIGGRKSSSRIKLNDAEPIDVGSGDEYTFDGLADGRYELKVMVTDDYGNQEKDIVEFIVDTDPHIEIVSPREEEVIRKDEVTIDWNSHNVSSQELRLNDDDWIFKNDTSHTFENLSSGYYTIEVKASEHEHMIKSANFSIDTSPHIEMITPEDKEIVSGGDVKVEWISENVDHHEIRSSEGDWINVSTETSYHFEDLWGGRHSIAVRAAGEPETTVTVDLIYYETRGPIMIEGDHDLAAKAEENGWAGEGTEDDPYMIDWYEIDGEEKTSAVHIEDVSLHFVIRNCRLLNSDRTSDENKENSGISLHGTSNGLIEDNELRLNFYGIRLEESSDNSVINNTAVNNHAGIHTIDSENNEFLNNEASKFKYPTYGQGMLVDDSDGNEFSNNRAVNNDEGIFQTSSDENLLLNNNLSFSSIGLRIEDSEKNTVRENYLSVNSRGMYVRHSDENEIEDNEAFKNAYGVFFSYSNNNTLYENSFRENYYGIRLSYSEDNEIEDNSILESVSYGIYLFSSERNHFTENELVDNGLYIWGQNVGSWNTHTIDETNTVNGRPILYLKNQEGITITEDDEAGQIILANSTGITIEGQEIVDGDVGILLGFSDDNLIRDNVMKEQIYGVALRYSNRNTVKRNHIYNGTAGIYLADSDRNTISENDLIENIWPGVYLASSEKNLVFGNNLTNNHVYSIYLTRSRDNTIYHNEVTNEDLPEENEGQAYDNSNNRWDDGSEGNFWSDYLERYPDASDKNDLGVWNMSYEIAGDGNEDHYPLKSRDSLGELRVQVLKPIDGETMFSSEVTVIWASKGGAGDIEYSIRLNQEGWQNTDESRYTFHGLQDGEHNVEVQAEDEDGETSTHEITFTVNTGVNVEITSPEEGEIIRRSRVTVEWSTENAEFSEVRLDGPSGEEGEWQAVGEEFEYTFEDLEDGDYTVKVRSGDGEGNLASDSVEFSLRTVSLEIISPEDGQEINEGSVLVEWTSENAEYHEIQVCGGRWDDVGNATEYEITGLKHGEYEISVRARDAARRISTDSVSFTVEFPLVISPDDGTIFGTDNVTVQWGLPSPEKYGSLYYEISHNDEWKNVNDSTQYTFDGLEDGEHTVRIRALDDHGIIASDRITFLVDTRPPDIRIVSPQDHEVVTTSDVTVEWEGEDEISGIDRYQIRIDGGEWKEPDSDSRHTFVGLQEGEHTVEIRAYDRAGNAANRTVTFELEVEEEPPYFIWFIIGLSVTAGALFLIRVGLVMMNKKRKEKVISSKKTLQELEEEHHIVGYDEYEEEYKL